MTDIDMSETLEIVGSWFLPDTPARRVAGTFSLKPERIELELADSLRPLQSGPIRAEVVRYPVVHGITRKQEAVSLFQCTRARYSLTFASGGIGQPETLWSHLAVVGGWLTEQQVYPELRCRIPGLQVWLSPQVIHAIKDEEGYAFRVKNVPTETFAIPSIDAELDFELTAVGSPGHSKATIVASAWLNIRPREPRPLNWFLDQLSTATSLLAFLAEEPMPPDRIELKVEQRGVTLSLLVPRPSVKYCDHGNQHDFFVSRARLGDGLGPILANWFELFQRVQLPIDLALSTMASDDLWLHVRFLSLLQALEGLHRALFPGNYMEPDQYEPVKEVLVKAIPSNLHTDHRAALKSRIRYGNEISLAKRLKRLAEVLPVTLRTRILGSNDVPRSWVDTRNYYTHWDEALRSDILSGQAMYDACARLTIFLRTLYLHKIGISSDALEAALGGLSGGAQHLAQLNSAAQGPLTYGTVQAAPEP
ncbi:HEPN domain-containing protein [Bradyrhizobium sp. AZCC 2230]|uniref:ApeA N-terminal domain 1-containing protein n=1 Tax=Bradyrhizobium sp. AZCC 2230 TaxID=3117021 RepID=UPI002FF3A8D6